MRMVRRSLGFLFESYDIIPIRLLHFICTTTMPGHGCTRTTPTSTTRHTTCRGSSRRTRRVALEALEAAREVVVRAACTNPVPRLEVWRSHATHPATATAVHGSSIPNVLLNRASTTASHRDTHGAWSLAAEASLPACEVVCPALRTTPVAGLKVVRGIVRPTISASTPHATHAAVSHHTSASVRAHMATAPAVATTSATTHVHHTTGTHHSSLLHLLHNRSIVCHHSLRLLRVRSHLSELLSETACA